MNKYFQIMWIAVAILAGWAIRRWPKPAIALVLVVSALSPALIAVWHVRSDVVALSPEQEAAGRWIAANTPERAVFVTDAFINSPVDLAGQAPRLDVRAVRRESRLRPRPPSRGHQGHLLRRSRGCR